MHAQDPIQWRNWSESAFQQAQALNRPILVSSGYFACHWCHVMHQENYLDQDIARQINQNFIAVKIDRELLPNIDETLMRFARQTTGQAGWPLHVFLTPAGTPFASFVYQPKDNLIKTLAQINDWWTFDQAKLVKLAETPKPTATNPISRQQLKQALLHELPNELDPFQGGLNGTQKFPHSPLLIYLLNIHEQLDEQTHEWLVLTLESMQNEHLHDQVHHGFFRYTVDPNWQEPHFEKMLYDNAQLTQVFYLAARTFQRLDFAKTASTTLAMIQSELYSPITGLYRSSQSAIDSQGQDGGRYLWTKAQLQAALTETEYQLVNQAWLLEQAPTFQAGWLPKTIDHPLWTSIQAKLKRPAITDSKQVLSWNGLLLNAYAEAHRYHPSPITFRKGHALAERLITLLTQQSAPKALNESGQQLGQADSEDYAYVLAGLQAWQNITGTDYSEAITKLHQLASQTEATPATLLSMTTPEFTQADSFTPAPNAILTCPTQIQRLSNAPYWSYASYLLNSECE